MKGYQGWEQVEEERSEVEDLWNRTFLHLPPPPSAPRPATTLTHSDDNDDDDVAEGFWDHVCSQSQQLSPL